MVLGGVCYSDLNLLGVGRPYPQDGLGRGQGHLTDDPAKGGTWPWPWLSAGWAAIPYPASTWNGPGWPGGGWETDPTCGIPTWPGGLPAHINPPGLVRNEDVYDAIRETDDKAGNPIDHVNIGNYNVLYSSIVVQRRAN